MANVNRKTRQKLTCCAVKPNCDSSANSLLGDVSKNTCELLAYSQVFGMRSRQ